VPTPRYALYAAPAADHPLWIAAASWLGRNPEADTAWQPGRPDWLAVERWQEITADPRLYGFHGTLKPPFALAADASPAALTDALKHFAASVELPPVPLTVAALSGFLAVVPARPVPALTALADRCVEAFDRFRAPPDQAELARRRQSGLSATQEQHLLRWGYPYVFDQFRYHMTLTGRLREPERSQLQAWLAEHLAPTLAAPVPLQLALFAQADRGQPFRLLHRFGSHCEASG
jgi:putative phosphonate metabolism protein